LKQSLSSIFEIIKNLTLITLGILSAGLGLKGFLIPNNFIDGGITGISLLTANITSLPLPALIFILNLPFIYLGLKQVNRAFAVRTLFSILGLSLALIFIDFPIITQDKLLVAIFGGFFLGAGIGLTMRGGCVLDGTEILALTLSKKISMTVGDVILVINIIIFSAAAYLLGIETALYSILTYLAASKTIDFIIQGVEEYTGVTIISDYPEKIKQAIIVTLGRGVTIYKGKRGFGKAGMPDDIDIVFTVVTRLELSKLKSEIEKIDDQAFVIQQNIKDTKGGMIKKKPLHWMKKKTIKK